MTDNHRPRPEYGEYATPQEQAKAIAKSQPLPSSSEQSAPGSAVTAPPPTVGSPGTPAARGGSANRLATIFLLALGIVYVVSGVPSYLALPVTLDSVYEQWGIGSYAATGFASTIGIVVVVSQAAIWIASAALAIRRLRRGRSSWGVPLAGAAVTFAVTVILMAVVIMSDPAFTEYLTSA